MKSIGNAVADGITSSVKFVGKSLTGDFKGAYDEIKKVPIVGDIITTGEKVGEGVVKLGNGDLEGFSKSFTEIPLINDAIETGKEFVGALDDIAHGDFDKFGEKLVDIGMDIGTTMVMKSSLFKLNYKIRVIKLHLFFLQLFFQ